MLQPSACNFSTKETLGQMFSCEFYEISKNSFFTEHLRATTGFEEVVKAIISKVCLETCQTSRVEFFSKIVDDLKSLTTFAKKTSFFDV